MTPPTGYVLAERVSGVVKVTERVLADGTIIPGAICGPGDSAVISADEAASSDFWKTDYTPTSTSTTTATSVVGTVPAPPSPGNVGDLTISKGGN